MTLTRRDYEEIYDTVRNDADAFLCKDGFYWAECYPEELQVFVNDGAAEYCWVEVINYSYDEEYGLEVDVRLFDFRRDEDGHLENFCISYDDNFDYEYGEDGKPVAAIYCGRRIDPESIMPVTEEKEVELVCDDGEKWVNKLFFSPVNFEEQLKKFVESLNSHNTKKIVSYKFV